MYSNLTVSLQVWFPGISRRTFQVKAKRFSIINLMLYTLEDNKVLDSS